MKIQSLILDDPENEIIKELSEILFIVDEFNEFLSDNIILDISNKPILLFYGEAGIGKSFNFN